MTTTRYRIEYQRTMNRRWVSVSSSDTPERARSLFYKMWSESEMFRNGLCGKIHKTRLVKITESKEVVR